MADDADLTTSFLDLLLSALGGVALLVVLFAAIQTIDVQKTSVIPARLLVIEVEGHATDADLLLLGAELSCLIESGTGESVRLFEETGTSGDLKVSWGSTTPRPALRMHVYSSPSEALVMRFWLASLDRFGGPPRMPPDVPDTIRIKVFWAKQQDQSLSAELKRTEGWYVEIDLPEAPG